MNNRPQHSVWVRIVHACPDAPALEILANGHPLVKMLGYGDSTPYMRLPAGTMEFVTRMPIHPHMELCQTALTFERHLVWTLVLIGGGLRIQILSLRDMLEPPASNRAGIRPILLVQGYDEAQLSINGRPLPLPARYGHIPSSYTPIRPGMLMLSLRSGGRIWLEQELDLDGGANWTALIIGRKNGVPAPRALALADSAWVLT